MWTSLARLVMALLTTRLTRSMIGAVSTDSRVVWSSRAARRFPLRDGAPARCCRTARRPASAARPPASPWRARRSGSRCRRRRCPWRSPCPDSRSRWPRECRCGAQQPGGCGSQSGPQVLDQAEEQRVRHREGEEVLFSLTATQIRFSATSFGISTIATGSGGSSTSSVWEPELVGQRLRDLFFSGEIQADEHGADALAGGLVLGQRDLEIIFGDEPGLNQTLADLLTHDTVPSSRKMSGFRPPAVRRRHLDSPACGAVHYLMP